MRCFEQGDPEEHMVGCEALGRWAFDRLRLDGWRAPIGPMTSGSERSSPLRRGPRAWRQRMLCACFACWEARLDTAGRRDVTAILDALPKEFSTMDGEVRRVLHGVGVVRAALVVQALSAQEDVVGVAQSPHVET